MRAIGAFVIDRFKPLIRDSHKAIFFVSVNRLVDLLSALAYSNSERRTLIHKGKNLNPCLTGLELVGGIIPFQEIKTVWVEHKTTYVTPERKRWLPFLALICPAKKNIRRKVPDVLL